jgi:hypothetical protein
MSETEQVAANTPPPETASHPARWWWMIRHEEEGLRNWLGERIPRLLDFLKNSAASLGFLAVGIALGPFVVCGDHWWHLAIFHVINTAGVIGLYASWFIWSQSFGWKPLRVWLHRFGAVAVVLTMLAATRVAEWNMSWTDSDTAKCNRIEGHAAPAT